MNLLITTLVLMVWYHKKVVLPLFDLIMYNVDETRVDRVVYFLW